MYWKMEAFTAKRTAITQTIEGSLEDVKNQATVYGLEILSISPDYMALIKSIYHSRKLSSSVMAAFFNDFAEMQKGGLSINDALNSLSETTSNTILKEALRQIGNFINDGRSMEEAFENTKIFPKIVTVTISAAEKTGNVSELLGLLSKYYTFKTENKNKIIKSLIYPGIVLCMLSGLSVFISITLVPQLKSFLPPSANNNLSATILIGYSYFIKEYWWAVILGFGIAIFCIKYLWDHNREKLMEGIYSIPVIGNFMKNIELSQVFLNLFVYQKSGVNIIQALTNINQANKTYITDKLIVIRGLIFKGASLGDAFKQDKFFPPFVCQNLIKGQVSGTLTKYFEYIYKYYDTKTKESTATMIAIVEPMLMVLAASFLLMMVCAFILPIYTNMSQMGRVH